MHEIPQRGKTKEVHATKQDTFDPHNGCNHNGKVNPLFFTESERGDGYSKCVPICKRISIYGAL